MPRIVPSPVMGAVGMSVARAAAGNRFGQLRQAEVEHLHAPGVLAFAEHDVARLEIAVGDALLVRRGDRIRHGNPDGQQSVERKTAFRMISARDRPSTSSIVRNTVSSTRSIE